MQRDEDTTGGLSRRRIPLVLGVVGTASIVLGYLLEWIRQRGDCELGDPSPDTLLLSIALILLGGGLLGLLGVCLALVNSMKRHHVFIRDLVMPTISMVGAATLFLFAGSGPGGWFQYCGT